MEQSTNCDRQSSRPERASGRASKRNAPGSAGSSRGQRQKVTVACEECRERKRRCSGTRPQCDGCVKKGRDCTYGQYALKRGWPSGLIETMSERIAELEKAQNLDMRLVCSPSTDWPGSSDTNLPNKNASSTLHPSENNLDDSMNSVQSVTNLAAEREANSRRSSRQHAPVWPSSTSVSSNIQLIPINSSVSNSRADSSIPTRAATLDDDKDESCVDAMGAMAVNQAGVESNGKALNPGFFGTSSAISFMSKVKEAIRNFKVVPAINFNEGVSAAGTDVSPNGSGRKTALFGLAWKNAALDQDYQSVDYLIPTRRDADALVESYFENVFFLRPYLNRATFQKQYMKLWNSDEVGLVQNRATSGNLGKPYRTEFEDVQFYVTLNLVFALGCRTNPSSSPHDRLSKSERFFQRSQKSCIFERLNEGSLELVQSLMLMGQYLQSTERSTQCWNVIGLAIRVAQGIGLHLDLPASTKRSQLEVEMRRRVWWGCIALDRELSMTYGRPCMVHPAMNRGMPLPSIIDDEVLSNRPAHEIVHSEGSGVLMAFFVYALKLCDVLCEILITLHCQDCRQQSESPASGGKETPNECLTWNSAQNLLLFDARLNRWLESLPPYLLVAGDEDERPKYGAAGPLDPDAAVKATLKRQAKILYAQYLHVRILLLRPLLLELFDKEHTPPNSPDESGLNSTLQRTVLSSISNICVSTAQKQIDHMDRNVIVGGSRLYAWWYSVYYIYTCATVILTGRLCSSIDGLAGRESLAKSWDTALKCLESHCTFSQPAQKGYKALIMIDQRLFKQQSTNPNNDQRNLGPLSMEEALAENFPNGSALSMSGIGVIPLLPLVHPIERSIPFQSTGARDGGWDADQNDSLNIEGSGINPGMDFIWNREELQLDWLNSMPFVEEFEGSTFGFDYGGGFSF